jgi:glycosyltransferase involved in cell wall biosynthesis
LKVVYIISNASLNPSANTGYARHIRETIIGLESSGHSTLLICAWNFLHPATKSRTVESKPELEKSSLRSFFKPMIPSLIWESIKDFKSISSLNAFESYVLRQCEEFNPDVVLERTSYLSNVGVNVGKKLQIPVHLEVNAPHVEQRVYLSGKSLFVIRAKRNELSNYQNANTILPVSEALAKYIENEFEINPQKLRANHNGVSAEDFQISQSSTPNTVPVIGFIGSIMDYHGVDSLIRVSSKLHDQNLTHHLLIVGDGQKLQEYIQLTNELRIESHCTFTGGVHHKKVPEYLGKMDICVLPSTRWYCSPIKLFEYGLGAKSIVAVSEPSVEELIEEGKDGMLFSSIDEMQHSLSRLIQDDELRVRLGEEMRRKVTSKYLWKHNAERLNEVIQGELTQT